MQIQVFDEHFGFSVMLSRIPAGDAFFMQSGGKWKLLLTTSSMVLYKFQTIDYGDKLRASVCMCVRIIFAAVIVETPAGFGGNIFFTPRRRRSLSFIYISSHVQNVFYFYFSRKSFYHSESISYDGIRGGNEQIYYRNRKSRTTRSYC